MRPTELAAEMRAMLAHFQQLHRLSGSVDAERSVDWLCLRLASHGIAVRRDRCDLWLSDPLSASLTVEGVTIAAKTRSFAADCPQGVDAALVYDSRSLAFLPDCDTQAWVEQVRGKLVVADQGYEDYVQRLMQAGAAGLIHIWGSAEAALHEETVGPIWGTPVPDDVIRYPRLPVVSISQQDGQALLARLQQRPLRARLATSVREQVAACSLPVVEIAGESEEFVLLSSHYDSWHQGVTDNATGNALCYALALHFAGQPMRRGLRIAFWPGHSNARYGGSTWFADRYRTLLRHCVAHINVDSPGCLGGTQLAVNASGAESPAWINRALLAVTGQPASRLIPPAKGADNSFWGVGIPLHLALREMPAQRQSLSPGSGGGWWWHTEEDTLDKVDEAHLWRDLQIHQRWLESLLFDEALPLDAEHCIGAMRDALAQLQQEIDPAFSLQPIERCLAALAAQASAVGDGAALRRATGLWHRARYRASDDFHPDLSYHGGAFPGLQLLRGHRKAQCSPGFWLRLETQFYRQRDRVCELLEASLVVLR